MAVSETQWHRLGTPTHRCLRQMGFGGVIVQPESWGNLCHLKPSRPPSTSTSALEKNWLFGTPKGVKTVLKVLGFENLELHVRDTNLSASTKTLSFHPFTWGFRSFVSSGGGFWPVPFQEMPPTLVRF